MNLKKLSSLSLAFGIALCAFAPVSRAGDKDVAINANDTMKYDLLAIDAVAGQTVNITLTNIGKSPKIAMAHNIVILKPGTDVLAFVKTASTQAANDYIPDSESDNILGNTKLLGPGENDVLHFTPTEPGVYPYVCTFPAHAQSGMIGAITVK